MRVSLDKLPMGRGKAPRVLVLDVRRRRFTATEFDLTGAEPQVLLTATHEMACDLLGADSEVAGTELRMALEQAGIRTRRTIVCLPTEWMAACPVEVPADLSDEDVASLLQLEAERAFPWPLEDVVLSTSHSRIEGVGRFAVVGAVPLEMINALEAVCRAAKLAPAGLTVSGALHEPAAEPHAVLVQEDDSLLLRLVATDGLVALRPIGHLPDEDESSPEAVREDLARQVRVVLRTLPEAVRARVARVTLQVGRGQAALLERDLAPVLGKLDMSIEATGDVPNVAALAATAYAGSRRPPFEFLRPRISRWKQSLESMQGRGILMRGAIAAGVLVLLTVATFTVRQAWAGNLERRWQRIAADVAVVEKIETDIRACREWYDPSIKSLEMLKRLTEAFPVGGEVSARSLELRERNEVVCSGVARTADDFRQFQKRLSESPGVAGLRVQQLRGENPVQFSLTFEWNPRGNRTNEG